MTKLVHNPFSQDVYADAALGFFTFNGNLHSGADIDRSSGDGRIASLGRGGNGKRDP